MTTKIIKPAHPRITASIRPCLLARLSYHFARLPNMSTVYYSWLRSARFFLRHSFHVNAQNRAMKNRKLTVLLSVSLCSSTKETAPAIAAMIRCTVHHFRAPKLWRLSSRSLSTSPRDSATRHALPCCLSVTRAFYTVRLGIRPDCSIR